MTAHEGAHLAAAVALCGVLEALLHVVGGVLYEVDEGCALLLWECREIYCRAQVGEGTAQAEERADHTALVRRVLHIAVKSVRCRVDARVDCI